MKRVAIYSRKSKFTGKGDSIENQIEMCKKYISNKMGKNVQFSVYEDEGFSGSTTNRPQFKKMINDIKLKKMDILVCYRLDRISRNVADFSSTLEILQENNCSFVSIREEFDTSTPMGRAMIYIASVFAQLERETIAERVRDNMLELARNGRWTGGKIPIGFISKRIKYLDPNGMQREYSALEINEKQMDFVKFLYEKYLELGSLHKLEVYITENQLKSRSGALFEKSTLKIILQNPIYVKSSKEVVDYLKEHDWNVYGEADGIHSLLTYNKTEQTIKNGKHVKILKPKDERFATVSKIKGAIDSDLWLRVQNQFDENRNKFPRLGKTHNAILVGKLKCGKCKKYMLVHHGRISKVTGEKLFYYTCSLKQKSHGTLCDNGNAKASYVEDLVIKSLKLLASTKKGFMNNLKSVCESNLKSNKSSIEKLFLEKAKNEKQQQIDTLVTKLSKSQGIEDIILDKIKALKKECINIDTKIKNIEDSVKKEKAKNINLKLIESIINKCKIIDTLPRNKQKEIIDFLIDTIYWYGSGNGEGKIKIKFIGTDEDSEEISIPDEKLQSEMLQFGSPCTCYVNRTATFKKIFEPIESNRTIVYSDLQEHTIAEKIYKLRMLHGLTQREFAKTCSIGYSSLCQYEIGFNPSIKNLKKISKTFKLDINYFFE